MPYNVNQTCQQQILDNCQLTTTEYVQGQNNFRNYLNYQEGKSQNKLDIQNGYALNNPNTIQQQQQQYNKPLISSFEYQNNQLTDLNQLKKEHEEKIKQIQAENKKQIENVCSYVYKKDQEINEQKDQIKDLLLYKEFNELLTQQIQQKENQVIQLKNQIQDLENQKQEQIHELKKAQTQINQQKQEFQELKQQYDDLQSKQQNQNEISNQQIQKIKNQQQIIQELKQQNEHFKKFEEQFNIQNKYTPCKDISEFGYDIIISMKSILDLQNKELDVKNQLLHNICDQEIKQDAVTVKSNNKKNLFEKNLIIVGMQGQRNQGKTFTLNSLINENFPSEYYINTPGICMKYQSINDRNIIYIDSEGANGPVQIDYENNKDYQNLIKNQENNEQDDKNIQLVNKYVIRKHQYQKVTEQMQQEFVISNSHILIIMLTNITQEDVNLIHSIQSYLKKEKNSTQKRIFVMHNLKDFRQQECVELYIQNLKSLFPLRQQQVTTFEGSQYKYNSVFIDTIYKNVNHLFMANQHSQAGEIYNKFALDYLKEEIAQFRGEIKFNAAEKFQDYLNNNIQKYLTLKIEEQQNLSKKKELFEFNKEQNIIQLKKNCKIVEPKELQMDIFGYLQREFAYSIVKNGQKLYLLVDIPGPVNINYIFKKSERLLTLTIQHKEQIEQGLGETIISTRKNDEIIQNFKIWGKDKLYIMYKKECKDLTNGIYQFAFIEEQDESED